MELFGYKVEHLCDTEFEFNYKLTKGAKTVYLINSLGRLLPVSEDGRCGKLNQVMYFKVQDGQVVPER